jgi:hypothetical protein
MTEMRVIGLISAALLLVAGCSAQRVVDTGEWETVAPTSTETAPRLPPTNTAHLANAFDFVAHPNGEAGEAGYYFSTPSGRWQCAILPRIKAGCQSSAWPSAMGIPGEPAAIPNAAGEDSAPNAIVIEPEGEPRFTTTDQSDFALSTGPATVLPFNRALIVAWFRCNIQETGVSCLSEQSGKGFTFSADEGFAPQYTEVPVDAP